MPASLGHGRRLEHGFRHQFHTSAFIVLGQMADATGLLVECRDEPGVLHRITEVILRHSANITYVAGGARGGPTAEIQLEVSGAADEAALIAAARKKVT